MKMEHQQKNLISNTKKNMKTFEYKVEKKSCSHNFKRDTIKEAEYLKDEGMSGWELVSVVPYDATTNIDDTTYYWKKEK